MATNKITANYVFKTEEQAKDFLFFATHEISCKADLHDVSTVTCTFRGTTAEMGKSKADAEEDRIKMKNDYSAFVGAMVLDTKNYEYLREMHFDEDARDLFMRCNCKGIKHEIVTPGDENFKDLCKMLGSAANPAKIHIFKDGDDNLMVVLGKDWGKL